MKFCTGQEIKDEVMNMGVWGLKLYQNDTSSDVKDEFVELFNAGNLVQEITDKLLDDYKDIMGNSEEEALFWFALADTQWNKGVLLPSVKERALYWINRDSSLFNCQTMNISEKAQRKKVLEDLRVKLLSQQPLTKKPVKKRVYKCQWKLGDIFAYRLESDVAKEKGLYGQYFLIQKVDEGIWYPGHVVPIVYVKLTRDGKIPSNVEEYNKLEYVQTGFSRYEERFWPIDMSRPKEDIAEKSKIDYRVDEYGFLPQYRVMLINTSKKVIPTNLIYVGNFMDALRPQIEFVPHTHNNIRSIFWKKFEETFESRMIESYCGHNLKELSIYTR